MKPRAIHLNIPISKIDEEQRKVWGFATVEEIDAHGEIIGYDASKKAFANWIGNIREMHGPVAVGKAFEIEYDDKAKGVWLGAKISESADGQNAWQKIKEGILAGYSIGGMMNDYETIQMTVDGVKKDVLKITDYTLGEVSLVDNPACPSALLEMVKSVDGKLEHKEKMQKGAGRPVHWWEKRFKFADSQRRVMNYSIAIYNKDSMEKEAIRKDVFGANYLTCLATDLAYFIAGEAYEGKKSDDLINALKSLKAAAATELNEDEMWPEPVGAAIELAMKALDITKEEFIKTMETKKTEVTKSEETPAEETKPAEVVAEETEEAVAAAAAETPADEAKPTDESETPAAPVENAAPVGDLKKNTSEGTDVASIVKTAIDSAISPLVKTINDQKQEIEELKKQPLGSKSQAGFVEKQIGDKAEMSDEQKNLAELLKRAEVLAADAKAGTPRERVELAIAIRKSQRLIDPQSRAQHAALRATFPQN